MPTRRTIFANGAFYHIYNRSLFQRPIFVNTSDCKRALSTIFFYCYNKPPTRFSYFLKFGVDKQKEILDNLQKHKKLVEIITYCLMPNHYHFLLKQNVDNGISNFVRLFQNSYTRFFNIKNETKSYVFEGRFKAVRLENEEQLMHTHRYIHLNPFTSYVVKTLEQLEKFPYSSFPQYLKNQNSKTLDIELILSNFKSPESYKTFIFDQANYQRTLNSIKHLMFE